MDPHFLSKVFPFLQCGRKLIIHFFISQTLVRSVIMDESYSLVLPLVNDSRTSQQGLLGEFHYLIKTTFLSSLD